MDNNTIENVKRIIFDNRNDIAFIIGNGLNLYGCDQVVSWKDLLKKIGDKEFEDFIEDDNGKMKDGISYTEIFDALESHRFKERMEEANWDKVLELISKEVPEIKPIGRWNYTRFNDIKRRIKWLLDDHRLSKSCIFTDYDIREIRNICFELGIEPNSFIQLRRNDNIDLFSDTNSSMGSRTNDDYLFSKLNQLYKKLSSNYYMSVLLTNELKERVCNELDDWKLNDKVSNMLTTIFEMDAPILTTNFDLSISRKMEELHSYQMKYQVFKKGMSSEVFTWSYYYGRDRLYNPCTGFGIWHMHGIASKPQSLCLGLSDYMRLTEKAWEKIHKDSFFETDMFAGKNTNNWKGYRTWLHIIFNKSLFIMGLNLGENETFLRWLLIQRAKYFALFPDRKYKGWYVYPKEEEKQTNFFGKKVFLEKVGFEMLPVENYDVIYQDLWR